MTKSYIHIAAAVCILAAGIATAPTRPAVQPSPLPKAAAAIEKAGGRFSRDYMGNLVAFLKVENWTGTDAELARFAELDATQGVSFNGKQPDALFAQIPKMPSLRSFSLSNVSLSESQMKQVAAMDVETIITSGGEGALMLQGRGKIQRLRIEDAGFTQVTIDGLSSLEYLYIGAGTKFCGKKIDLNLGGLTALKELQVIEYRPEGLKLTDFPQLETIKFYNSVVPDSLLAELAKVTKLKSVSLTYAENGDAALRALANSSLRALAIDQASDEGFSLVRDLAQLETLHLAGKNLTARSLRRLADSNKLTNVSFGGKVDAEALAAISKLPYLESLTLNDTGATDEGVVHLAAMPALAYLELRGTAITDKSLEALGGVKTLKDVDVRQTGVTEAGVEKLKAALPRARVVADAEK